MGKRLAACTGALILSVTGCAVSGKSFSMDSVSRTPFFGLSLQPKGPEKSDSIHRSISRDAETPVPTENADRKSRTASGWKGWWPGTVPDKSESELPMQTIPLPRTDIGPVSESTSGLVTEGGADSSGSPF